MIIKGQAYWAKVLGAARPGYKNQYNEWSIDVALDQDTIDRLVGAGMDPDRIKNKGDDRGNFITFKRRELKKDGSPAKPIRVVDHQKNPWNEKDLIGNGSEVACQIVMNEGGDGIIRPSLIAIQVIKLVEFEGREDFGTYDDDGEEEQWD